MTSLRIETPLSHTPHLPPTATSRCPSRPHPARLDIPNEPSPIFEHLAGISLGGALFRNCLSDASPEFCTSLQATQKPKLTSTKIFAHTHPAFCVTCVTGRRHPDPRHRIGRRQPPPSSPTATPSPSTTPKSRTRTRATFQSSPPAPAAITPPSPTASLLVRRRPQHLGAATCY